MLSLSDSSSLMLSCSLIPASALLLHSVHRSERLAQPQIWQRGFIEGIETPGDSLLIARLETNLAVDRVL